LVLLAILIGYRARCFAGRLARGLALAAACCFEVFIRWIGAWEDSFDVRHGISPFLYRCENDMIDFMLFYLI